MKRENQRFYKLLFISFLLVLTVITVVNLLIPDQTYSETENRMLAEGIALESKRTSGGASAPSPAYQRLQDVSRELEELIGRSRGRSNKDLARLADQLRQVMEKWDS